VDEVEPDEDSGPPKGFRVYRKLPKPVDEMTDEELDEFAGEFWDAMNNARLAERDD
jgi:hypothetical protein